MDVRWPVRRRWTRECGPWVFLHDHWGKRSGQPQTASQSADSDTCQRPLKCATRLPFPTSALASVGCLVDGRAPVIRARPDRGGHKTRLGKRASNPLAPSTRPGGLPIADALVVITSDAWTTKRSQLRLLLQASSFESPQLAELLSLPYLHGWSGSGLPTTEQMRALQRTVHSDDRTTNGRSPPAVTPCSGVTATRPQTPSCGPRSPTRSPGSVTPDCPLGFPFGPPSGERRGYDEPCRASVLATNPRGDVR